METLNNLITFKEHWLACIVFYVGLNRLVAFPLMVAIDISTGEYKREFEQFSKKLKDSGLFHACRFMLNYFFSIKL